jgi:hypothetical protein
MVTPSSSSLVVVVAVGVDWDAVDLRVDERTRRTPQPSGARSNDQVPYVFGACRVHAVTA